MPPCQGGDRRFESARGRQNIPASTLSRWARAGLIQGSGSCAVSPCSRTSSISPYSPRSTSRAGAAGTVHPSKDCKKPASYALLPTLPARLPAVVTFRHGTAVRAHHRRHDRLADCLPHRSGHGHRPAQALSCRPRQGRSRIRSLHAGVGARRFVIEPHPASPAAPQVPDAPLQRHAPAQPAAIIRPRPPLR